MKKVIPLLLMMLMLMPLHAQLGEKNLNRRYLNEIRDSLSQVILNRQKVMQRNAERTLAALPNDEKLYDESYISVVTDLIDTFHADGSMHLDLVYRISYNCRHLEGYTDDYPLGAYDVDTSNSARAICNLTEGFLKNDLKDIFLPGKEVEVTIFSTADGTEFLASVPYDGRYGDFRYCPVTFNGEKLRVSVDQETGIRNNCELAYIRAQSVRDRLEGISTLQRTVNNFRYVTRSYRDSINTHYYRRSSIEMRVSDVFTETVERMQRERMQDDHVDYNIPETSIKNPNTYVLIIANENYGGGVGKHLIPDVPYALNDGEMDSLYFVRALGVPHRQVRVLRNATKADIEQEGLHWLSDLAKAVAGKKGEETVPTADIIICYAGHGFTDLDNVAYIVPTGINTEEIKSLTEGSKGGGCKLFGKKKSNKNAEISDEDYDIVLKKKEVKRLAEQCISIDAICKSLGVKVTPVKNLTLILDASFDGTGRNGKPIFCAERKKEDNKKGKKRKASLRDDAVVLLGAEYDKTAFAFDLHEHGFLTYFLLHEIKNQKENIFNLTYQDIYEDVYSKLNKESALQNRWQEIAGIAGGRYKDGSWKELKVKN